MFSRIKSTRHLASLDLRHVAGAILLAFTLVFAAPASSESAGSSESGKNCLKAKKTKGQPEAGYNLKLTNKCSSYWYVAICVKWRSSLHWEAVVRALLNPGDSVTQYVHDPEDKNFSACRPEKGYAGPARCSKENLYCEDKLLKRSYFHYQGWREYFQIQCNRKSIEIAQGHLAYSHKNKLEKEFTWEQADGPFVPPYQDEAVEYMASKQEFLAEQLAFLEKAMLSCKLNLHREVAAAFETHQKASSVMSQLESMKNEARYAPEMITRIAAAERSDSKRRFRDMGLGTTKPRPTRVIDGIPTIYVPAK